LWLKTEIDGPPLAGYFFGGIVAFRNKEALNEAKNKQDDGVLPPGATGNIPGSPSGLKRHKVILQPEVRLYYTYYSPDLN